MSSFNDNYRFFSFVSLGILVLFLSTTTDVFANEVEEVLTTNKRVWSVINTQSKLIDGKVKINKSSYSAEKIRASKPKKEQPHSPPQTAKVKGSIRKESRRSYATNSKGSATSILENANAVKPFCNINATTAFCIRQGESDHKYTGNTPRRHPRLLDYRDVNSKSRKHESKAFFQQLVRQSDR